MMFESPNWLKTTLKTTLAFTGAVAVLGGAFTVIGVYTDWKRPYVLPSELAAAQKVIIGQVTAVQQIAEKGQNYGIKAYRENLKSDQRYIDNQKQHYRRRGWPTQDLDRQQKQLNEKKCDFENSLLPRNHPARRRCY